MEGSTRSSMSKACSPRGAASSSCQESGWTQYFDYFMASEKGDQATSYGSSCDGSKATDGFSLVSDAASVVLADWNPAPTAHVVAPKGCWKLKRRTGLRDDSLEDTASSPVSSPKVSYLNKLDTKANEKEDARNMSQEKKAASGNRFGNKGYGMNEMDFAERVNGCEELKKKGVCLVPMSMLVDYFNN